jgi:hypothetical protein
LTLYIPATPKRKSAASVKNDSFELQSGVRLGRDRSTRLWAGTVPKLALGIVVIVGKKRALPVPDTPYYP